MGVLGYSLWRDDCMVGVWLCGAILCEYALGIVDDGGCVLCPVVECAFCIV